MERVFIERRTKEVEQIIFDYVGLKDRFINPPKVKLILDSQSIERKSIGARDVAITTAVQCYAPGVAELKERRDDRSEANAESTLAAGHHTTRMHSHFTWQIIGATRSVVHDVFHANPFYNSEQQSQRYVEAKKGNYLVPAILPEKQRLFFEESADFANQAYFQLLEKLAPEVEKRMKGMYPEDGWRVKGTADRLNSKIHRICQEIARYVLPIGQLTNLDHTLSELQLLRLFRASQMQHFFDEARFIIGSMVLDAANYDPTLWKELDIPLQQKIGEPTTESYVKSEKEEFDKDLGGESSSLLNSAAVDKNILMKTARNILGESRFRMSNEDILKLLMDPSANNLLADVYEIGMLDPLTSGLRQLSLTFATKLSHTADSQRQRQRRTPGATPPIEALYGGEPDYITPLVIRENPELKTHYDEIMAKIFANVKTAIELGISKEQALLLLPNALTVRLVESGDLFDWLHRWKQRLCYLAQEEICFISIEQVEQVGKVLPEAVNMLLAPCGIRKIAGIKPRCPEGERWCGQPVFNWSIKKYKENRLI